MRMLLVLTVLLVGGLSGCTSADVHQLQVESDIKSDYIEFLQYTITAAYYEGSLDQQYVQIVLDPDVVYPDIYFDELEEYEQLLQTIDALVSELIQKMERHQDMQFSGLAAGLATVDELRDFQRTLWDSYQRYSDEDTLRAFD